MSMHGFYSSKWMREGGAAACVGRQRISDVQQVSHVRKKGRGRWKESREIIMSSYKLSNLKGL